MKFKVIVFSVLTFLMLVNTYGQHKQINILVFSKTAGYRHQSIPAGIKLLTKMGDKNNWKVNFSEDSNDFTDEKLSKIDVLVFLSTSGNVLNVAQQKALQKYVANGNGFVGIHSASGTELEWDWYSAMIGAKFKNHPKVQTAELMVDTASDHPSIKGFKEVEVFKDEWYNFVNPVAKYVTVLASVDESSYEGQKMNTDKHPISWYHHYDGGRVFYTALGHTVETINDVRFYKHIEGGVLWASGV